MRKIIIHSLLYTIAFVLFLMGILSQGVEFTTLDSYLKPRLITAVAVIFITVWGMLSIFKEEFIRKLLPYAVVLPVLWAGIFTWAYGFVGLPEKRHLGDYYMYASLLFTLPYLSVTWASHLRKGQWVWNFLQGLAAFIIAVCPFVYVGYYIAMGGEMDIFALIAIMATNIEEVQAFFETVVSPTRTIGVIVLTLFLFFLTMKGSFSLMNTGKYCVDKTRSHSRSGKIALIFVTILFLGGFIRMAMHVFPLNIYRAMHKRDGAYALLEQMNGSLDKNAENIILQKGQQAPDGTYIVIVGESANRDHMKAFTPHYAENTTPWFSEMVGTEDVALGYKAYSNFPTTIMSLSYALTSANQYGDTSLKNAISLMDALRAAGYETDWISFQSRSSLASAAVTMIAERSDRTYWEQDPDEKMLDVIQKLPPAKKRVIFVHMNGSHYSYTSRVPEHRWNDFGISTQDPDHDYDVTLAYNDWIFKNVFEYAREHMHLQAMIYFSDHGENMVHYHGTSPFFFDMVHIPFFVYLSPEYRALYPELMVQLQKHAQIVFTNDLIFDTVAGLFQAKTNFYNPEYDFSSPQYSLTKEQALTFHGKEKISDDLGFHING